MKLTVLGGGGVRAPLFVYTALKRAGRIHLDELCLMDTNPEKLERMGALSRIVAQRQGSAVRIATTRDPEAALDGAAYIVTTLRVGEEQGRIYDERIALRRGVLGQETTGPGGFAMAIRSIPAILNYAALADKLAPGSWIFNFTNPAGLVAQALHNHGFDRTVGICDGANLAQTDAAKFLGLDPTQLQAEVFGLNHLSWGRRVLLEGKDILPGLLKNPDFWQNSSQHLFEPELIRHFGMFLNEYLFYYYYAEKAVESIQKDEETRGEEILRLNRYLLDQLGEIEIEREPERALQTYTAYEKRRGATYMHYARPDAPSIEQADRSTPVETDLDLKGGEGYAGVALNIIEAFETGAPVHTALNVPNRGAIDCMLADDVVEVSCVVDRTGIHPQAIGAIPEAQELLMRAVKLYERRTVEAVLERSRQKAYLALMVHPLVLSYSLARALVDEYLKAHAPFVGDWK